MRGIGQLQATARRISGIAALATTLFVAAWLSTSALVSADPPLAAQLLAQPYASTGVRVNITNLGSQMRGLTNDGSTVYAMNQSGNVYSVPLSSITMTEGQAQQNVSGTLHTPNWGVGGAPSMPSLDKLSLAYSRGCLFITNDSNTVGTIKLYCIDVSDWSVTEIAVPGTHPLPVGYYYVESSLIDFPDGRIGKVSGYSQVLGGHESTLRTYTVTGTGKNVSLSFSEDYMMSDTSTIYNDATGWARDEHGIATDGTYLYRIQWNSIVPNTKVWALASGVPGEVAYEGSYTQPYSNMHYLSHNHVANNYLMGHFWGSEFFITTAADPGPGPGNPLVPTFAAHTPLPHSFTVQITNYNPSFTWQVSSSAGSATVNSSGLVTVTGLAPEQSATITVTTEKTGIPNGSAGTSGAALGEDLNGDGDADTDQPHVMSGISPESGTSVALAVTSTSGSCTISDFSLKRSAELATDAGYSYPMGLLDFAATCGAAGFTATIKQYYYSPPSGEFVVRKYASGAYRDVPGATTSRETIHGQPVLVVTYDVTDGGPLDDDGSANGTIVDPAGPALLSVGAPNTGSSTVTFSGAHSSLIAAALTSAFIALTALSVRFGFARSRR